jgi:hypothetical protein
MVQSYRDGVLAELARTWTTCLATYKTHQNMEHIEALMCEAVRFCGVALEADLKDSPFWNERSLAHRAALLLYLVDRGIVERARTRTGRPMFLVSEGAEEWVMDQLGSSHYTVPTLELLTALRLHLAHERK